MRAAGSELDNVRTTVWCTLGHGSRAHRARLLGHLAFSLSWRWQALRKIQRYPQASKRFRLQLLRVSLFRHMGDIVKKTFTFQYPKTQVRSEALNTGYSQAQTQLPNARHPPKHPLISYTPLNLQPRTHTPLHFNLHLRTKPIMQHLHGRGKWPIPRPIRPQIHLDAVLDGHALELAHG